MNVTVILCTYNRCASLRAALQSVASSIVPESIQWEVLVVDNNSRDQTKAVVHEFVEAYPGRFRYLFEPRAGKSYALNAGIQAADCDAVAFMDDDVTVEPTWLARLTSVFQEGNWAGAGGPILPPSVFKPPRWLSPSGKHLLAPFALFNPLKEPGELTEPPWGTNMSFRRAMFERHGGFRTDLGPAPGSEIRSEDTEFGRRLMTAGERLYYVPSAIVYHPVSEARLRKRYHLAWWFDKGRADVREFGVPAGTVRVQGVPVHLFGHAMMMTLRWTLAATPSRRFGCKLNLWTALGMIKECWRERYTSETPMVSKVCVRKY